MGSDDRDGGMNLNEALNSFLNQSGRLKKNLQAHRITEAWESIMGKTVANYTEKIQLTNHTLFITTHVAPLRSELMYQKETIKQRVNELLGEGAVKEVVIQ
ncbi:MAG TPA: DUF721 domain-containing protein [Phnomibacter sp.]|nr:DUF721 domain-containing protein [Phnomibacter sp.]